MNSQGWQHLRLKYTCEPPQTGFWGDEAHGENDIPCVRVADMDRCSLTVRERELTMRSVDTRAAQKAALSRGDLLIEKSGGGELQPVGAVIQYTRDHPAISSNFLARLRPKAGFDSRFLTYLHASLYTSGETIRALHQTTGIQNLDLAQYLDLKIHVPQEKEQRAIARWLDETVSKIDQLARFKERLLRLLDEKRQAIIDNAVSPAETDVGDTGSENFQQTNNWRYFRIKYALRSLVDTEHKTAPFYPDGKFLVVRTPNVRSGELILTDAKYTDEAGFVEWTAKGKPEPGDILFTREAPAGEACLVPPGTSLCVGQRVVLMKPNPNMLLSQFAIRALYGGPASEFIRLLSQGTTVSHFNMADIGNIPLWLPPLSTQAAIAGHLDSEAKKFNQAASTLNRSIERLREYRSALITAAVTGQLDLRAHEKKMEALA